MAGTQTAGNHWSVRTVSGTGVTVVLLHGDVDFDTAAALHQCIIGGIEGGTDVVLDLSDTTLLDCTCLGALMRAHRVAGRTGRTLALAAPRPLVRRTLALTGVDTVLPVFPDGAVAARRLAPVARAA